MSISITIKFQLAEKFQFQLRFQLTECTQFSYEFQLLLSKYHCRAGRKTRHSLTHSLTINIRQAMHETRAFMLLQQNISSD